MQIPILRSREAIDSTARESSACVIGFGLQSLNVIGKATLGILLARCLSVAEMGLLGMLVVTTGFAAVAVGLNFNKFGIRELLRRDRVEAPRLLRDQLIVHLLAYALAGPGLLVLFAAGFLPWRTIGWLCALIVLEDLGRELQELLIAFQRPRRAALLCFVRQGLWVYALIGVCWLRPRLVTIDAVCAGWSAGAAAAVAIALYWLRDIAWWQAGRRAVDWRWLWRGVKVATPFLLAALSTTAIGVMDRYAVFSWCGVEKAGIYNFYLYARSAMQSLLEVGIGIVFQTRLLFAYRSRRTQDYHEIVSSFAVVTIAAWLLMTAGAGAAIGPIVALTGKSTYRNELGAFWVVLTLPLVAVTNNYCQFALYARERDWLIAANALIGLLVGLCLNAVLVPRLAVLGAAVASVGAVSSVALLNWRALGFVKPQE